MRYEDVKIDEKEERIRLIKVILESYLTENPYRPEGWHGTKFNYLYDLPLDELRVLHGLCK